MPTLEYPSGVGPYERAAHLYRHEGWAGVLPLPPRLKWPPPNGWTGATGRWPSGADIQEWVEYSGSGNIALRLPKDVIGLDVDAYPGKCGGRTYGEAVARWGPPGPTWCSTSRADGTSGIYLYRVPDGLRWPGQLGPDVEVIQYRHRYAMVHPSVHPSGNAYRWVTPDGHTSIGGGVPAPDDLGTLAEAWVHGLALGGEAENAVRHPLTDEYIEGVVDTDAPCRVMGKVASSESDALLRGSGSRHDATTRAVMHVARLRGEGHRGARYALAKLRQAWSAIVAAPGEGQRTGAEADGEWRRMVAGALAMIGTPMAHDPCADDLAGILPVGWQSTHMDTVRPTGASPTGEGGGSSVGTTPVGLPPGVGQLGATGTDARPSTPVHASVDQVLVSVEVSKLRVRREAKRLLDIEEVTGSWRMPPAATAREMALLPDEPLRYVVAEVMPEDSNILLTAQFKSGKTTTVNHLAQCLLDGTDFLGAYAVDHDGDVAIWNYEVSARQYARWVRDLGVKNDDRLHVMNIRGFSMPLISDVIAEIAVEWLRSRDVRTWIVDPFARAFIGNGENENSNSEVGRFLDLLDQIKERSGVAQLILPTHTGRASAEIGTERARGATRLDDWADVRWALNVVADGDENNAPGRYFRASGRDVDVPEGMVVMDPLSRALRLESGGRERPRQGGSKRPPSNRADAIVAFLGLEGATTQNGIGRGIGGSRNGLPALLSALVSQGVICVEEGPRGARVFSLPVSR